MRKAGLLFALAAQVWIFATPPLAAAARPVVELGREGLLVIASLPEILSRPEVKPHLTTGLTTSLFLRVTATDEEGRKTKGGGKVDIRWEPWDEMFLTTWTGIDGRSHPESLPSFERLVAWWRQLRIPATSAAALGGGETWDVRVEVRVVPFSEAERRETQRWFSDSLGQPPPQQREPGDRATAADPQPLNRALDLLMATSIQRRSLATYRWAVLVRPGSAGRR
jgi:hypothetical protein